MILKYICSTIQKILIKHYCSSANVTVQILADSLGLSLIEAKCYTEKHKILKRRPPELILETITCCKKLGYSNTDILENPMLLSYHAPVIHHNYLLLEEGGFHEIKAKILARTQAVMRRTIRDLKGTGMIKQDVNVAKNFIKYIKPGPDKWYLDDLTDDNVFRSIHRVILTQYLRWRLNMTDDELARFYRIHCKMNNKSFRVIEENLQIAESLNIERNKIIKCGYLLHSYPEYPKTVLRDFPNIAGADLRYYMRMYPKLVTVAPKNFIKIYGVLKEFEIPDESIRKYMPVFTLSPETVRLRLEEIHNHPDLNFLLKHPRILSLIHFARETRSRLSFLQELQIKCASVMVTRNPSVFETFITDGKDVNLNHDVMLLLKDLFKADEKTIKRKMKVHPYTCHVPFAEMLETFNLLRGKNFRRSQIFHVMHVILYPKEKVANALEEIYNSKNLNPGILTPVQKLNLVVYLLEKRHHFTGNGIWRTDTNIQPERSLE